MALIVRKLVDLYFYLNDEVSDPRVQNFLFMSNPFPMFFILAIYLTFILKWGPNFMKNRKPYDLSRVIIAYNIIQIVACIHLVIQALQNVYKYKNGYNIFCEPVNYTDDQTSMNIATGCHTYFLLKLVDLLDTVFFVLRKKTNQISFLHLYHHTGMVILTWNATKFLAGGHSVFTGFLNSIIHIVMYTYYLVSAFRPQYKNNLWWKKYITQMQIVQFFLIMTHWMFLLFHDDCGFPLFPVAIMVPQNLFMLALFADFYYKTYIKKRKSLSDVKTTDVQAPDDTIQQTINNKVTINGNSRHRIIDKKYVNGNANGNIVS